MAKKTKAGAVGLYGSDKDWQAESDLRTLMDAECIERDPKRLAAAQKLAKDKMLDIAAVITEGAED